MIWTPIAEDREDAAQHREEVAREAACRHLNTVVEMRGGRRLVEGQVDDDIRFVLVCTDCGKEWAGGPPPDGHFGHEGRPGMIGGARP